MKKKVIVTGGRNYQDKNTVYKFLNKIKDNIEAVIQGGCSGADYLAVQWAKENEVPYFTYPAPWKKYGKAAGPIRNRQMLEAHKDALVIAFPGGDGTKGCIALAKELKMLLFDVEQIR